MNVVYWKVEADGFVQIAWFRSSDVDIVIASNSGFQWVEMGHILYVMFDFMQKNFPYNSGNAASHDSIEVYSFTSLK